MSYADFLSQYENGERVEWVDGEVIPMPPISLGHSDAQNYLTRWVGEWVEHFDLGKVQTDPFQMKTSPTLSGRAPDLIFVAKKHLNRLRPTHLEGPADVVIEIISPGSRTIDRVEKFQEYQAGGVREYWLIDPALRRAEFYRLNRSGKFEPVAPDAEGVFRSTAMKGFWIVVDWLWNPPTLKHIRQRWGIA